MDKDLKTNWGLRGHDWAVEMLKQQIRQDSVRHAYLFCGPAGVGRRTLAIRFIQALNCLKPPTPGQPCGECKSCQQIERMQYTDLLVLQAEKEGGTLEVKKVRDLRQSISLMPYQGRFRVVLFLRFQEANASSANALLKTLEEASEHLILILTAGSPEELLPTIVSRCEVLRLRPLPVESVEALLKEHGANQATAELLAHVSTGRPGYALGLMENKEGLDFRAERLKDLNDLLRSTRVERFAYAEKLTARKKDKDMDEKFRQTLQVWLSFWRDVLLCRSGAAAPLVNVDRRAEVEALAARLSLAEALKLTAGVEAAIDKLERNVNPRLLAEVLLLDWPHV